MANKTELQRKLALRTKLGNIILVSLGVVSAAFGLKSFLIPNHFIDGGVMGISLLLDAITPSQYGISLFLIVVNAPFIVMGYNQIHKLFAIKTTIAIVALAMLISLVDFPIITSDKLLVSVFGGFFIGMGIGLSIRGGCVIDGTEILAVHLNKNSSLTIGDIILIINVIIFGIGAFVLGIENALYSMLTYLSASRTIDFVVQGIEEYTGVTIISIKSGQIKEALIKRLGRGVTVYKGERGYGKTAYQDMNIDILYTVITRLEISKLKNEIDKIDPSAFLFMNNISEVRGGLIKKRPLH
ncbi:MAG: YitT family protein [Mucilaginibacter polytrichastri]|nr:YitT family protein [Mucilaginibacter polytrichastri]